jgi:ABC-2 type transport system ATP-binding protein
MTDPRVLFLDEPTLGLDVEASRDVRRFVKNWVREDLTRTLLLTTHYMMEADDMCDRVAIINKGKVLACDTPAALKQNLQRQAIFQINVESPQPLDVTSLQHIPGVASCTLASSDGLNTLELVLEEDAVLAQVIAGLTSQQARMVNLQKREPTLEDVFVHLVGLRMEEVELDADDPTNK